MEGCGELVFDRMAGDGQFPGDPGMVQSFFLVEAIDAAALGGQMVDGLLNDPAIFPGFQPFVGIVAGAGDVLPECVFEAAVGGCLTQEIDDLVFHDPVEPGFHILNVPEAIAVFPEFEEYLLDDVFDVLFGFDQAEGQAIQSVFMLLEDVHKKDLQGMLIAISVGGVQVAGHCLKIMKK